MDINIYIELLKRNAIICMLGALEPLEKVNSQEVAFHHKHVAGSLMGCIAETREVLNFCARHRIGVGH